MPASKSWMIETFVGPDLFRQAVAVAFGQAEDASKRPATIRSLLETATGVTPFTARSVCVTKFALRW